MSLPLKARVTVRDHFDAPDCAARKAIQALGDALGRTVQCEPEWPLLVTALQAAYGSVPVVETIAGLVHAWCRAVLELLEDGDDGEAWGETLLEAMDGGSLKLTVDVVDGELPSTAWNSTLKAFTLRIPKSSPAHDALALVPHLRLQAEGAFKGQTTTAEDWTSVAASGESTTVTAPAAGPALVVAAKSSYMPSVASLPPPDKLLLRPPYHMIVYGGHEVRIQCSHGPSLEFLAAYLKKWCRANTRRSDKLPLVAATLGASAFGISPMHDTLTVAWADRHAGDGSSICLPLLFHLIEGALGYERVYVDASCWQYRRDEAWRE
ncbi:Budding site selection protein [Purpureocillium lavendulum]|uniref:Budding site selection protein n=1 Tax=Purpureocillium lavendulum TaxID=1247861 RepID=A0AB34G1U4_9HYPO|nr:Budding site selection protein [Purpureocillium lavendulum]